MVRNSEPERELRLTFDEKDVGLPPTDPVKHQCARVDGDVQPFESVADLGLSVHPA